METTIANTIPNRYGFTEKKKAYIDLLNSQIIDAEAITQQQLAIVTALSQKSKKDQGYLLDAENYKAQSLSNKNLTDQVVQNTIDLIENSDIAFNKMTVASLNTQELAKEISLLINKLIYSVEIINKLSNLVIGKKTQNPLISDELISKITTVGTDANNAVALTLIALKSIFTAQTSCLKTEATSALEQKQALKLYTTLTGKKSIKDKTNDLAINSLQSLLHIINTEAKISYVESNKANDETNKQLSVATINLDKAQIKLKSLQAALAAANAALLAS